MLALLPWADLLNHGSEATGIPCLVFDDETHVATLRAHTEYQPGQGVYDSYSPGESPGQLFLDYGFVDWGHVADTVDLPASVLRRGAGKKSTVFLMSPAGLDSTLLAWTRVETPDELAFAGWTSERAGFGCAGRVMAKFVEPVSRRNELQALLLLICACDEQLRRYPLRPIDSPEGRE